MAARSSANSNGLLSTVHPVRPTKRAASGANESPVQTIMRDASAVRTAATRSYSSSPVMPGMCRSKRMTS